jgi:hypothetical protein
LQEKIRTGAFHAVPKEPEKLIRPAPQLAAKAAAAAAKAAPKKTAAKKAVAKKAVPTVVDAPAAAVEIEVPPELLAKPFKELTKEERVLVSRARSRAMRAKAGVPVAGKTDGAPPEPVAAAPEEEVREEAVAAASVAPAADPMAEVPPELLAKPFKELTKEERVLVSRARSRAMRAKAGLPVPGQAESAPAAAPVAVARDEAEPEEEPAAVARAESTADPMTEVPPELLAKPFKDLSKEERILVARAKSRAMRAKVGKPVSGGEA